MHYLENPGIVTRYATTQSVVQTPSQETIIVKESDSQKGLISLDTDKGIKLAIIALIGAVTIYILSRAFSRKK